MQHMSSAEVRQSFLDFFEEMGHKPVASSSLVPANDPTLLFVNAGMVQFKDVFLGLDRRDYKRATTSQKCMRVSGKHNDLENVGPSPRHQTFFEMLGNFSFGDYFKRDAIKYAYELLTVVYKLPADRLVFTVYENDDKAYDCWVSELGISPKRVARMGPSTNFWQMADTGPCGPTSEIHWDNQPELGEDAIVPMLQAEDDRFLEIWNLVFMQFNRQQADPDHSGQWDVPLPAPGVDTGMGLERIVSVLQGVEATYDTDLFTPIIQRTQELTGHTDEQRDGNIVPYRVIADHIRAAVFLISDGVLPGARGRSSIPRVVIRRAARYGRKIGLEQPFLAEVADSVIKVMGEHYPELVEQFDNISQTITQEEERFLRTMERGLTGLEEIIEWMQLQQAPTDVLLKDYARKWSDQLNTMTGDIKASYTPDVSEFMSALDNQLSESRTSLSPLLQQQNDGLRRTLNSQELPRPEIKDNLINVDRMKETLHERIKTIFGEPAHHLNATQGLPFQVTRDFAADEQIAVDEAGFAAAEAEHARISGGGRAMGEIETGEFYRQLLTNLQAGGKLSSAGVAYDPYSSEPVDTSIVALVQDGAVVDRAIVGERVEVALAETNFYVEAGGQVSDTGTIKGDGWLIEVESMRQPIAGMILYIGEVVEGNPVAGDPVSATVDSARRKDITRNHTATHLLHAALRNQLGTHVQQKGSLVAPDRLRFDFSHPQKVSDLELASVADEINRAVLDNCAVRAELTSLEAARKAGAMALFGEKYSDTVRTVIIENEEGRYSYELCGGVHVRETAEIGSFVFTAESSVSAGIRRVEALTGIAAYQFMRGKLDILEDIAGHLGTSTEMALGRIDSIQADLGAARREIDGLRRRLAKGDFDKMLDDQLENVNGKQALVAQLDTVPPETMREMTDWFRNRVDKGVMVLASDVAGKPHIVVAVTDPLVKDGVRAGDLIKPIAKIVGGGGGGRPQMAQAGGTDCSKIAVALAHARDLIAEV